MRWQRGVFFGSIYGLILAFALAFGHEPATGAERFQSVPPAFDCANVSDIPQSECAALVALYVSTNGDSWLNNDRWLENDSPCTWYAVVCAGSHVNNLHPAFNNLSGPIPKELGNLSELQSLILHDNQLVGPLPLELGKLTKVHYFNLATNRLTGNIPLELGQMVNLQQLWLHENQLGGTIPPELDNLIKLRRFSVWRNQLRGVIPIELGNLAQLEHLGLGSNQLSGHIPPELGNLAQLQELHLSGNQLEGAIPASLGQLSSLQSLGLDGNQLNGTIPSELGNLTNLTELRLGGNRLIGPVPSTIGNLVNVVTLILSVNELSSSLPPELGNLAELVELRLEHNKLTGPIPSDLGQLQRLRFLSLDDNKLSGTIPPELGNIQSLEDLWLHGNQLTGQIPPNLGKLSNLRVMSFGDNHLTGVLPSELGNLSDLRELWLNDNQLRGKVPLRFGQLSALHKLYLSYNQLTGPLPITLTNLISLTEFSFLNTALCEQTDPAFQSWLASIPDLEKSGFICGQNDPGSISGTVTEKSTGNPISAVEICIWTFNDSDWRGCTHTGTDGFYMFSGLPANDYRVKALKLGYGQKLYDDGDRWHQATPVRVTFGAETQNIDFALPDGGIIEGRVSTMSGVMPLANIGVDTGGGAGQGTCTDENGRFRLPLPTGTHKVVAGRSFCGVDAYIDRWWQDASSEGTATPLTITTAISTITGIDFILTPGGSISGRVMDDGVSRFTNAPITDVQICVWPAEIGEWSGCVETGTDGHYTFGGLTSGDYFVRALKRGYGPEFFDNHDQYRDAERVAVQAGQDTSEINFALGAGGVVRGTIYDGTGTRLLPNVGVDVDSGFLGTCTDQDGHFVLTLPLGTHKISAGHTFCGQEGYRFTWWQNADDENAATPVMLTAGSPQISNVNFTLARRSVDILVEPLQGGTLFYNDLLDIETTINVPSGAVNNPTSLVYTADIESSLEQANLTFAGMAFSLEAYQNDVKQKGFTFQKPISITIQYSDTLVANFDEANLALYFFDGNQWMDVATTCTPTSIYERKIELNELTIEVCHLSEFALFESETDHKQNERIYLPTIIR